MFAGQRRISGNVASSAHRAPLAGLVIACLLELCLAPVDVWAQTDTDRASARALAEEGYHALKAQQFDIAEDRFRRADALVHSPTFVVDDGRALIGLGRFVEARERFELVLREGVAANAPAAWKRSLSDAAQLLEEVKPKVAWLTISLPNVTNAQVKIDGQLVPPAAFDVRRATNPGARKIEATADGYESQQLTVELGEGAQQTLTITMKQLPSSVSTPVSSSISSNVVPAPLAEQRAPVHDEQSSPKLAYVAFGVGGLGIAVGAVTGILALRKRSDLTSVCHSGACPPSAQSDIDAYHLLGRVSGVGFGLGLAAAASGFVLLSVGGHPSPKDTAQPISLNLRIGPNRIGLEGTLQ